MGNCVFTNKNYRIYRENEGFVVHNKHKSFEEAHTHCRNFVLCKVMIYVCLEGKFPKKFEHLKGNERFLISLTRVCTGKHRRLFNEWLDEYHYRHSSICEEAIKMEDVT